MSTLFQVDKIAEEDDLAKIESIKRTAKVCI
jgi:hypothetical protein